MFKRHQLRALVNERLKAAAEEIFRIFETTIKDYEEILLRSQQEVDQQQSRLAAWEGSLQEEAPPSEPCPIEKKTDLCEDDQEPPRIKEEQQEEEELWTAQPGDTQQEEADTNHSMFNIIYMQWQDDDAQQFPHKNLEAAKKADHLNTSSHRQLKSEPDKEGCDASEATGDCQMSEVSDDAGRVCGGFDSGAIRKKPWQGDETADSSHTCSICNRNFRIKSILIRHMKTHTGEKPHSCTDCGKRFREKADLIKHTIIHTGEKPSSCGVCDKSFIQRSYLHTHMNSHSGKKPHTCSFFTLHVI